MDTLCYTTFDLSDDIGKCHVAVQEQSCKLKDFRDSIGLYNQGVKEMEDNLASKLSTIQESTNMSFKTDYDSGLDADAEIMLIYINSLLTKRIDDLSDDEKEFLDNVENVLGAEDYKELKDLIWSFIVAKIKNVHVMDEKTLDEKFNKIISVLENKIKLSSIIPEKTKVEFDENQNQHIGDKLQQRQEH